MPDPEKLNNLPERAESIFEVSLEDQERMRELEKAGDAELQKSAKDARQGEPDANEVTRRIEELKAGIESEFELSPTKEMIFELLGVETEKCVMGQEKYDENGSLYRLDFKTEQGIEYDYMKAGEFEGSHVSPETYICETTPTSWPEKIYLYDNGSWKNVR